MKGVAVKAHRSELVRKAIGPTEHPRVYVATPVQMFSSPQYQAAIEWAKRTFPKGEVWPSHTRFASILGWLEEWPTVLKQIDLAVVVTRPDRTVGRGVFRELSDLCKRHTPIIWWQSSRRLHPSFVAQVIDRNNWHRYARLSPLRSHNVCPTFVTRVIRRVNP
jgi:hypothetical protein